MCQVPEVQSEGSAIIIMCIVITNSVIEHFARIRVHSPTSLCECRFESFLFVLSGPYL